MERDNERNPCHMQAKLEKAIKNLVGDENTAILILNMKGKKCSEVRKALQNLWPHIQLRWVYSPKGPRPSELFEVLVLALCKDEPSFIDKLVALVRALITILGEKLSAI